MSSVRGADQLSLDLNKSKLEIKLKITLEKGYDVTSRDRVGPLNDILNALFMSMEMELGGCSSPRPIQNTHI